MHILGFYCSALNVRNEEYIFSEGNCPMAFCEELEYWQIDEVCLENCCRKIHTNMRNGICDEMAKACTEMKTVDKDDFTDNVIGRLQRYLWDVMENPEANGVARLGLV